MIHNLVLRRLRYALNLKETDMQAIFALAGHKIKPFSISLLLKKEDEQGYLECTDAVLEKFLDGLIIQRRGVREGQAPAPAQRMNNNLILKKIRIAFELKEDDLLDIMDKAGFALSRPELSALFRKYDSRNYKACGDQLLRNFLHGICEHYRPKAG
ncbi:DUF1456 family protein [Motilimonas cestriensis]|uniref:DUF1456 family protein n=1 Tax=Motilimonas cestriensis TaxID=2742685 RepID=A0ABS8W4Z4_9GAMM|nr:DUF1456 family protein [Motilimonas cestriensis]MCE2593355.1 DUF1456 family protein [Motilimonas cestriensis]